MASVLRFRHGDEQWWLSDLTGPEVVALERQLGVNYVTLDVGRSARDTLAILTTFLSRTRSEDEVAEIIAAMKLADIGGCWTLEEDDLPTEFEDGIPKSEPASTTTTTGLSSLPDLPGAGLPMSPDDSPSGI